MADIPDASSTPGDPLHDSIAPDVASVLIDPVDGIRQAPCDMQTGMAARARRVGTCES